MPIKAQYCDQWFEACKADYYCYNATSGDNSWFTQSLMHAQGLCTKASGNCKTYAEVFGVALLPPCALTVLERSPVASSTYAVRRIAPSVAPGWRLRTPWAVRCVWPQTTRALRVACNTIDSLPTGCCFCGVFPVTRSAGRPDRSASVLAPVMHARAASETGVLQDHVWIDRAEFRPCRTAIRPGRCPAVLPACHAPLRTRHDDAGSSASSMEVQAARATWWPHHCAGVPSAAWWLWDTAHPPDRHTLHLPGTCPFARCPCGLPD